MEYLYPMAAISTKLTTAEGGERQVRLNHCYRKGKVLGKKQRKEMGRPLQQKGEKQTRSNHCNGRERSRLDSTTALQGTVLGKELTIAEEGGELGKKLTLGGSR